MIFLSHNLTIFFNKKVKDDFDVFCCGYFVVVILFSIKLIINYSFNIQTNSGQFQSTIL